MARSLTIRRRVIIAFVATFLVSTTVVGLLTYEYVEYDLRSELRDMARNENHLFNAILSGDAEGLARAHSGLVRLESLHNLFAARKRDELLAAARPVFDEIKRESNITHMYFIEPDGTVFLRVHRPEDTSGIATRTTFRRAARTGRVASGMELGQNFFSLRSVRPISSRGELLGYMELAEEIDHVFGQMKRITGNDVALFLSGDFLQGQSTRVRGEKVGKYDLLYPTNRELTLSLAAKLHDSMDTAMTAFRVTYADLNGRKYAVAMGPVQDAAGTTVGLLFSQKDVSPLCANLWKGIVANILTLAVVLAASLGFLFLSLKRSLDLLNELKERIMGVTTNWDLTHRLEVTTDDETGVLARAFNLMMTELTARKRELHNQIEFLQILMETMPIPIYFKDVRGRYLGCNSAFGELLGLQKEEIVGKGVEDLMPGDRAEEFRRMDRVLFSTQEVQIYEGSVTPRNGVSHEVIFYRAPFPNADGTLGGLVGSILDISELKQTEAALRASESHLRAIVDYSNDAILLASPGGTIHSANPEACRMFGMTEPEVCAKGWEGLVVRDSQLRKALRKLSSAGVYRGEIIYRRSDGTTLTSEVSTSSFTDRSGCEKTVVIGHDITTRKRLEEELRQSEERYRLLVDNAPDAIVVLGGGVYRYANAEALRLFGAPSEGELIGRPAAPTILPGCGQGGWGAAAGEGDPSLRRETKLLRSDGRVIDVEATGTRIVFRGEPAFQLILRDVTERKRLQAELAHKVAELEAALEKVKLLEGIIPICMYCKKIRDDEESWHQMECYIADHSEAEFSHGICPECFEKQMAELNASQVEEG